MTLSSISCLRTQQNRNRREQVSSRSSLLDLSFLEPVIGPRLHGCGTYWTYVEARVAGSSITTIKSSDTRGCRFVMETSLPVMSEVSAPHPRMSTWLRTLRKDGWLILRRHYLGMLLTLPTVSVDGRNDTSPTFETAGDPLLLIGRRGGRRLQDDRVVSFDLDAFQ